MRNKTNIMKDSHLRNINMSATQFKIAKTVQSIHNTSSGTMYFTVGRQQGTTTLFIEDIVHGILEEDYKKILIIAPNSRFMRHIIDEICKNNMILNSDVVDNILNCININDDRMYELDKYDYIYVDDFEYLNMHFINFIKDVIEWIKVNKHSNTKLIITSPINDEFDFKRFERDHILVFGLFYKIVDPELSDSEKEKFIKILDGDAYRREILCKRKYEVKNEPKPDSSKDIMDDFLNMTLRELMDYCSDNGLKMNFSIEKK